MIEFGSPAYFALGLLVLAMTYALFRIVRWRRRAREAFAGPQAASWPVSAFWPRTILLIEAALLIVFAAARPQWGDVEQARDIEGIDMVIALDVSQSMTAADVEPSRMEVAQQNLVRLVQAQRGSRIGLVLFAGTAMMRSPLTTDTQAMEQLILRADREAGLTRAGSDLGAALQQAANILIASENSGGAIILVSDGEDFSGTYAQQANRLRENGITVFTAGVGTEDGGRLFNVNPLTGATTPKLDARGQQVVTRLDERSLRSIADEGGGSYVRLDGGATGLLGIRNDLNRLDQTPLGADVSRLPIERFQVFAAAALVLLLLSWFLPSRFRVPSFLRVGRLRPNPGLALVVLALLGGACATEDSLRERNQVANEMFGRGEFAEALTAYQELLADRPDIPELSYNAGNTLHRLLEYERAITETQRALPPTDARLGADTYFALGNHLLAMQRLEEAYVAYRNALLLQPADRDAKHNLELTLLLLNQRDNPQDPNNPNNQGQGRGTPQAGQGTPGPGEGTPQPGEGTPQPGEGTPGSGEGTPGPGARMPQPGQGTPPPDDPGSGRALEDALAGIGEDLTFEEAINILDLLREQQQRQIGPRDAGTGPDY